MPKAMVEVGRSARRRRKQQAGDDDGLRTGLDLRGLHLAVEVLWLSLLLMFGYPYLMTAYVAAFGEPEDSGQQACPSAAGCGDFTGWLALANMVPPALIVLGYCRIPQTELLAKDGKAPNRRGEPPHGHKHLYWVGSVLGLMLITVQVVLALIGLHLLQSADRVSTASDGTVATVRVAGPSPEWFTPSPPRRLAEETGLPSGSAVGVAPSHTEEDPSSGRGTRAMCVGDDEESTQRCSYAFEMAAGWSQADCVGVRGSGQEDCIYVANILRPRTCSGNRDPAEDVQCTFPSTLKSDATIRPGSTEQSCCEKVGLCRGNTDGSPDIRCEAPTTLLPMATLGRDARSCCALQTCASVECVPPKVAKALDPSTISGSTVDECCMCAQDGERDLVDTYCVSKDDPNPEAENRCTHVMRYVGCGRFEQGQWVSRSTHCVDHPEDTECAACASEAPYLEFQRLAQTQGSAQDLCMDADRYSCRYIFRRSLEVISCREGMCFNNTFADAEPDIVCPPPSMRAPHAMDRVGRDVESCCVTRGMCIQDTDGEPDIVCEFPSRLRPHAELIVGRDQETCCHVTEMCVGNTDQRDEPDAQCILPAVLRSDASRRFRRAENPCDGCCVIQDMCVGNDICEVDRRGSHVAQHDIECPAPSELVPDAAVTRGRDVDSCCRTVGRCVGNTDNSPDIHCTWPALLRNNAEVLRGRTEEECCLTQGMCVGNSNPELEPDVVCDFPAVPLDNLAHIEGRHQRDCCIVTGYCAGNTDPAEVDVVCEEPRTPKGNLMEIRGRDYDACCNCFKVQEEISEEYCVLTDHAEQELDNQCTRVMKYAGCENVEACIEEPSLPECIACAEHDQIAGHSAFQIMARDHRAQDLCMAAGRYECTYIYAIDQVEVDPCLVTGRCIGNTDRIAEPDVVCPVSTELRTDAADITGNTPEECCTRTGFCAGNSCAQGTLPGCDGVAEPDVECPAPSQLIDADYRGRSDHRGRSAAECCVTHGMCVGNTRAAEEPDYDCPAPFQLNVNAAEISGRSRQKCCWCEEHTEIFHTAYCFKTELPDPDADNECTEVMRYADCPLSCIENGFSIAQTEQLVPECAACAQDPPYETWQALAVGGGAQEKCMAAARYGCTYSVEREHETSGCDLLHVDQRQPLLNGTHACECERSWLPLLRHPATDDQQVMHSSNVLALVVFMLFHFALRLYKVAWLHSHYWYKSPCEPLTPPSSGAQPRTKYHLSSSSDGIRVDDEESDAPHST